MTKTYRARRALQLQLTELPQVYRVLIEVKESLKKNEEAADILKRAIQSALKLKNVDESKDLLQISNRIHRKLGKEETAEEEDRRFRSVLNELLTIKRFDPSLSSLEKNISD